MNPSRSSSMPSGTPTCCAFFMPCQVGPLSFSLALIPFAAFSTVLTLPDTPAAPPQVNEHVAPLFRPTAPTAPVAVPHSTCGVIDANPGSAAFSTKQSLKLESAMLQSAQTRAETSTPQSCLDVFQILDSATGAVLFSYPPPSFATLGAWSGVPYQPEEFAYLAMNTKTSAEPVNDEATHTDCSTRFKAQHL